MSLDKELSVFMKKHPVWYGIIIVVFCIFLVIIVIPDSTIPIDDDSDLTGDVIKEVEEIQQGEKDLEMSLEEIFNMFRGLSEIQQGEKIKEFKGNRIKTSIYASKIDQASLSTQYVVLEMYAYPYSLSPYAKAFFPNEEKDNLLSANIGDTIVFSGEFVTYKERALTSYVEFTKSRFIEIE